ncbi:MAG: cob(I)yrinic acid a,c-diamide adenosyltransferase [Propionibacteriaceae bacterium]|nr:cob(I)yrinic acid a,c-diamide adenosyltransferase [Propionibacteriaceae bacterium]
MVNLTRIYTRTGDQGTTRLSNNQLVPKTDPRLEAYGTLDEANCAIGAALGLGDPGPVLCEVLSILQNDLFDVGADLSTPLDHTGPAVRIGQAQIDRVEGWCDQFSAGLPALRSFLLPGGSVASVWLNVARTVVRRAERATWSAAESIPVNEAVIRYINRLSDLLFILGRYANTQAGCEEILWAPTAPDSQTEREADVWAPVAPESQDQ